jgi:hypothetical protein
MTVPRPLDCRQLEAGFEFPSTSYRLDAAAVAAYLEAVDEADDLYRENGLVPPMAIVARAMAALSEAVAFPDGAVHVSQSVRFLGTARAGDGLIGGARVDSVKRRGRLHLVSIELSADLADGRPVLRARTDFVLPPEGDVA